MNLVHYPDKDRQLVTISLCGKTIQKIPVSEWGRRVETDKTQVTSSFQRVTCIKCMQALLIIENDKLNKIAEHLDKLEKGIDLR